MYGNTPPYAIQLFLAVTEELFSFARDAVTKHIPVRPNAPAQTRALSLVQALPAHETGALPGMDVVVEEVVEEAVEAEQAPTFQSVAEVLQATGERPEKNTIMYTGGQNVPLYQQPTVEFDGIIARIPYGAMVMVLEGRGRWSRVAFGNYTGYVLRDELIDRAGGVYPDFTIGEANRADDPNTLKVRACIEDEFGGGAADIPLQATEYVLYKLYRKGKHIAWPDERPRLPGNWHEILRGSKNTHMGIVPKEGVIMEYTLSHGEGHVAYVETMLLDETISISEANYPADGIYNERILTKEEWRELHPIFIEVA